MPEAFANLGPVGSWCDPGRRLVAQERLDLARLLSNNSPEIRIRALAGSKVRRGEHVALLLTSGLMSVGSGAVPRRDAALNPGVMKAKVRAYDRGARKRKGFIRCAF